MAICTAQAPFDLLSGKFGGNDGTVAMPTAGRNILRNMVIPANPDTTKQQTVRQYLATAAAALKTATEAQVNAWKALAPEFNETGRLSLGYTLSWNQLFIRVNFFRLLNSQAITYATPSLATPAFPSVVGIEGEVADADVEATITHPNAAASGFWFLKMSPALNSTSRQARDNELVSPFATTVGSFQAFTLGSNLISGVSVIGNLGAVNLGYSLEALNVDYLPRYRLVFRNVLTGTL